MYVKLFASLYQGTLRGRSHEILVFTNLLAHCDSHGIVDKHWSAISDETGLSVDDVKVAIANLEAPDSESRSPEMQGCRLVRVDDHRAWGWRVVNYGKYRSIKNEDDRREQNRLAQERFRNKHSKQSKQSKPQSAQEEGEGEAVNLSHANACVDPPAEKPPACPPCPIQELIDLYHQTLPELPGVVVVHQKKREGLIRQRWRDFYAAGDFKTKDGGLECFRWYFTEKVKTSKFLTGRSDGGKDRRPFLADLTWLMGPTNFSKVVEGRYE